jgi:glycosyltransferase involved in cell wall biosynthesis
MRAEAASASALPLIVVPCFNEERRLDVERLVQLAASGRVRLLFVDDGSTDRTAALLEELQASAPSAQVLTLAENVGKAEAIRRGLAHAIDSGASIVGYYDADLATPPSELLRLVDVLDSKSELEFVLAARVRLLGRHIQRHAARHYLGRLFATAASLILQIPVYDTQCGAKVFRTSPAVREAFARPFRSSWVFDVELIGRLLKGSEKAAPVPVSAFEEMPLREWRDVPGSRLRLFGMLRAGIDLAMVAPRLSRRGRGLAHRPGNHARSGHS